MIIPKVIVYADVSADGRLTMAPDVLLLFGDERWSAVAEKSDVFDALIDIHRPQAILEGSNSFVASSAGPHSFPPFEGDPHDLYEDFLPQEVIGKEWKSYFCVTDSRGRVGWTYTGEPGKEAPGSEGWHLLVFVAEGTPPGYLSFLRGENVPYLVCGKKRVDLSMALKKLGERLGVGCVMCTSAGRLGGALLRAGLVDEVNLDIFPAIIGGISTPSLFMSPELGRDEMPARLMLISSHVTGERVWLRYGVVRE